MMFKFSQPSPRHKITETDDIAGTVLFESPNQASTLLLAWFPISGGDFRLRMYDLSSATLSSKTKIFSRANQLLTNVSCYSRLQDSIWIYDSGIQMIRGFTYGWDNTISTNAINSIAANDVPISIAGQAVKMTSAGWSVFLVLFTNTGRIYVAHTSSKVI